MTAAFAAVAEALEQLSVAVGAQHPLVARLTNAFVELARCVADVAAAVPRTAAPEAATDPERVRESPSASAGPVLAAATEGAVLASACEVAAFVSGAMVGHTSGIDRIQRTDLDRTVLSVLADHVNVGADSSAEAFELELDDFERAVASPRHEQWQKLSPDVQARWLTVLVAWARALEDDARRNGRYAERVRAAFGSLREFSKNRPGHPPFVYGFARHATPKRGSWRADAYEYLEDVRGRPRREAVTKPRATDRREPENHPDVQIPPDWPHLQRVKGLKVVLFGGDVREERRAELERAFGFGSLEWVPHEKPRLLQNLCKRATARSVDLILVNKYVSHKDTESLDRASTTPIVYVPRGYGTTAIRLALEEHFARGPTA